jgi:hypothetical protein
MAYIVGGKIFLDENLTMQEKIGSKYDFNKGIWKNDWRNHEQKGSQII